jgi:lipopolysaccharide biosynthesis protein
MPRPPAEPRAGTVRAFAFYLPQFHPIPENDEWWGPGFTEWHNVSQSTPQFRGHEQPVLPADLGYYDLRVPELRDRQAELARDAGLTGFCYYHYWFNGRRILERPFEEVFASGRPDLPFMLCWANEPWTRAWDGATGVKLLEQTYSSDDDLAHIRYLCEIFADPRYARIEGKPAFLIYHAAHIPDAARTLEAWRNEAQRLGVGELYLARLECHLSDRDDPIALGFDAGVEFQPDWKMLRRLELRRQPRHRRARRLGLSDPGYGRHRICDYGQVVERMLAKPAVAYRRHPSVVPRWDNSPRRANGAIIFRNSTPDTYRRWLTKVVELERRMQDPVLFITSWNEWGEGSMLEPDDRWGRGYLEATRTALVGTTTAT